MENINPSLPSGGFGPGGPLQRFFRPHPSRPLRPLREVLFGRGGRGKGFAPLKSNDYLHYQ